MLKYATISRTHGAQHALQFHQKSHTHNNHHDGDRVGSEFDPTESPKPPSSFTDSNHLNQLHHGNNPSHANEHILRFLTPNLNSCNSSPLSSPSLPSISEKNNFSSAPSSCFNSPIKQSNKSCNNTSATAKCGSESMIKIFAQTLSQDVEYVTIHVNSQTKSQLIIRSLLKKFRLKHRDPNLFYLTLERWIRKDGLRHKSVMLLGDEACPLQLQQCCSSPPHDDIKFTLQMRAGALVKIYCSDVCPDIRYKCLSLSPQTTVDETVELMLHCLNLVNARQPSNQANGDVLMTHQDQATATRHANSPLSIDSTNSSASSASTNSTSSGVESDPTNQNCSDHHGMSMQTSCRLLDSNSRTSSVTSISSSSNLSSASTSLMSDQFCLTIECRDTNYQRVLESDEFLVDVYQSLLDEVRDQPQTSSQDAPQQQSKNDTKSSLPCAPQDQASNHPDQWFLIKLKRRDDITNHNIKFTTPRQNMPLPPIPLSLSQFHNGNLQHIVSTTQIEVNRSHHRPSSSFAASATSNSDALTTRRPVTESAAIKQPPPSVMMRNNHRKQLSASSTSKIDLVDGNNNNDTPLPPASLMWLPTVAPRRRNLSNASSTFGRQQPAANSNSLNCRRRYDPAQLARDLNQLYVAEELSTLNKMCAIKKGNNVVDGNAIGSSASNQHPIESEPTNHTS